jgi:uncharacterized protein with GYD domain
MSTYFMFGKYSQTAIKEISSKRTQNAIRLVEQNGGQLKAGYALLGETDLLIMADFPSNEQAMKSSVALSKLLGVGFTTYPAVSMEEFDKLVG